MATGITSRPGGVSGFEGPNFGYTPQYGSGPGSMRGYASSADYFYATGLKEAMDPSSMNFGKLPSRPDLSWNENMDRQTRFENEFSSSLGLKTGSSAMRNLLGLSGGSGGGGGGGYSSNRSSGGGISYTGGGGGGGPSALDFYMGKFPTLVKQDIPWQEAGKRVQEANQPFISEYEKATPGQEATLRNLSSAGADLSAGKVPLSVLQASQRATAQAGYGSGLGVGGRAGGIQRMRGARDIMQTSLDLMKQSAQIAATIPSILQGASQAKYQIAPASVFDAFTSQASANAQLANQQLISDWMNQPKPGQFDITTGSFVGMQPGSRIAPNKRLFNPYA